MKLISVHDYKEKLDSVFKAVSKDTTVHLMQLTNADFFQTLSFDDLKQVSWSKFDSIEDMYLLPFTGRFYTMGVVHDRYKTDKGGEVKGRFIGDSSPGEFADTLSIPFTYSGKNYLEAAVAIASHREMKRPLGISGYFLRGGRDLNEGCVEIASISNSTNLIHGDSKQYFSLVNTENKFL